MPELPEVETTVRDLNKKVLLRTFIGVWTDTNKIIKKPKTFRGFEKKIKGKKIKKIWRRGKNIIFELSDGYSLLIHQKLTGHLLVGIWSLESGIWKTKITGFLKEKVNSYNAKHFKVLPSETRHGSYIHLMFFLDNGKMLALSDLRKFAKVEFWDSDKLRDELKKLGPEPLEKSFTFEKFKEVLNNKRGKIKQVLMNQEIIVGIGNIYSDEALWRAKIHPFRDVSKLNQRELKNLYKFIKEVLKKSIKLRGESFRNYRDPNGKKGNFDKIRKVYRREGEKCSRCKTIIKRQKLGGRSTCFCPKCQKL